MDCRELKFRVWDSLNKGFICFDIQGYPSGVYGEVSYPQQFSGFKDKNDKEIYEGDILCYQPDSKESLGGQISSTIGKVYFEFGCFYFDKLPLNEFIESEFSASKEFPLLERIEIIGNTFENPELVKETQS